jgi:hypothetical protein
VIWVDIVTVVCYCETVSGIGSEVEIHCVGIRSLGFGIDYTETRVPF